uniref:Protein-lysine N-methyltransferase SMYD4 n=1 Tax=Anopheles epiroticus TaxID=199890 RepID=A0A182PW12_9DIPT
MIDSMVNRLEHHLPEIFSGSDQEVHSIRQLKEKQTLCDTFRSWLQSLPNVRAAGEDKSNQFRTRGNTLFKGTRTNAPAPHNLVLEAYSKAIFAAPEGSRALALGHANRAVILIRLRWYRAAFDDCQLALDGDYPDENRLKVLFRQAECVECMGEPNKLAPIIDGIARIASTKGLSKAEEKRLQILRSMVGAACDNRAAVEEDATNLSAYRTSLIEKEARAVGRFIITTEPIQTNEMIAQETAVSFVPVYDPENRTTLPSFDCQKCAKVNVIPFPCPTCGRACYCSSRCRRAHESVHRFECYGYQKHLWYRIGIAHLGLRSFLDGFGTIYEEMAKAKTATEFYRLLMADTSEEVNRFSDYGRVLRLVTNFDKMDLKDRLRYSLAGLMLTVYLQEFTPFATEKHFVMSPAELLVCCGTLITHHIGQLVCNGHAISELRATLPSKEQCWSADNTGVHAGMLNVYFKSARMFTAIFPRISMFNHSCDPNIRNHFNRSTLTVHATRPISAGGEIFNCYGPHYRLMSAKERQMHLRGQYCFDCRCNRCQKNDTFLERFNMICCPACRSVYAQELDPKELCEGEPMFCACCYEEIPFRWFQNIFALEPSDAYKQRHFQEIENDYNHGKYILIGDNQTKSIALQHILDHYTKYASNDPYLCCSLNNLALEYALLMRERFDYMSLEFLTGCFYLLDVWATFCLCGGWDEPHELEKHEERTILKQFYEALGMIGADNRAGWKRLVALGAAILWLDNLHWHIVYSAPM